MESNLPLANPKYPLYTSFELHPSVIDGEELFVLMDFNTFPGQAIIATSLKYFLEDGENQVVLEEINEWHKNRYLNSEEGTLVAPLPWVAYDLFSCFDRCETFLTHSYNQGSIKRATMTEESKTSTQDSFLVRKTFHLESKNEGQINNHEESSFVYLSSPRVPLLNLCTAVAVDYLYRSLSVFPELYTPIIEGVIGDVIGDGNIVPISSYGKKYVISMLKKEGKLKYEVEEIACGKLSEINVERTVMKDISSLNSGGKSIEILDLEGLRFSHTFLNRLLSGFPKRHILLTPLAEFNERFLIDIGGSLKAFHLRAVYSPNPVGKTLNGFAIKTCDFTKGLNNTSAGRESYFIVLDGGRWRAFEFRLNASFLSGSVEVKINEFPVESIKPIKMSLNDFLDRMLELSHNISQLERIANQEIYNTIFAQKTLREVVDRLSNHGLPQKVRGDLSNIGIKRKNEEKLKQTRLLPLLRLR